MKDVKVEELSGGGKKTRRYQTEKSIS